ncbi:glutamyl-tRNA reductase [Rhodothermus profundi]|uniref:Glutamyl-tRNA reductase n=1 Tax=Rhodothermus profundi TaxID=633813 RepID=A0A1M6PCV5_9BACT|nr:glutamyl-tRNA reductase [Rhodothermus profundi]SHK05793.1 glutamyl-tRNA reductase [Rhodothermus profundi]
MRGFHAFGLNHETASVRVREAFALDQEAKRRLYATWRAAREGELMLVSTCNRTEAYLYGTDEEVRAVRALLSQHAGRPWPDKESFHFQDEAALRHVLEVTCGLRSQVLGDAQIFSQIKEDYRLAVEAGSVGTAMHRLLHSAFRAAKRVASETTLHQGTTSVAGVAIQAACQHFARRGQPGLEGVRVLVAGAGEMARLALEALRGLAPATLMLTNRTRSRVAELAQPGELVVPWAQRAQAVAQCDLVIVATSAPEPVLTADMMPPRCGEHPLLLIDLSIPRNVDPAIDRLPGYQVLDLDAIKARQAAVEARRRQAAQQARQICEELLHEFVTWYFHQQALQPVIQTIRDTFEAIRQQEIERHHRRFSEIDREELDRLTRSIMQKLLAIPIVRLKSIDPDSIDFVRGIQLLAQLFSRPSCEEARAAQLPEPSVLLERARAQEPCPFVTLPVTRTERSEANHG